MSDSDFVRVLPESKPGGVAVLLKRMNMDPILAVALALVVLYGLIVLYSAVGKNLDILAGQAMRIGMGAIGLLIVAQADPSTYRRWSPALYLTGIILLALTLAFGVTAKGSRRWLDLFGLIRFQPSELMKVAVPLIVAWYLCERPTPLGWREVFTSLGLIALPVMLILLQPDLGTGVLVAAGGGAVIFLGGLSGRWILGGVVGFTAAAPVLWMFLQGYQKQRILTLFDPESDPLGAGWNILQSTTAIGSGGLTGKGLNAGTQSHLQFLPEGHTDFIMAVIGEELGFAGFAAMLLLYLLVVARGLMIAAQARHRFSQLAAGALTLIFFVYLFVNIAMVAGLLPVVGVPLPLVSYGGTSAITLMVSFGIVMAMRDHRP